MPDAPAIVTEASGAHLDFRLYCAFHANLARLPKEGFQQPVPTDVPLRGDWSVHITPNDSLKGADIEISHGHLPVGVFGAHTTVQMTLSVLHNGCLEDVSAYQWGPRPNPAPRGSSKHAYTGMVVRIKLSDLASKHRWFKADDRHRFRIEFCVQSSPPKDSKQLPSLLRNACSAQEASLVFAAEDFSSPLSKSVRLVFKRSGSKVEELWTTTAFLEQKSPYFRTLFASGCCEAQELPLYILPTGATINQGGESDAYSENAWEDSDEEAERAGTPGSQGALTKSVPTYREVVVEEASASTYRAVLLYLKAGYIAFAPLASNGLDSRDAALKEHATLHPDLLPPVSPKSVYRLAHLLQLDDLRKLALDRIAASLTIDGAAYELFHPVSVAYDEVRGVVRTFVVKAL